MIDRKVHDRTSSNANDICPSGSHHIREKVENSELDKQGTTRHRKVREKAREKSHLCVRASVAPSPIVVQEEIRTETHHEAENSR